jgi:hypothetical protein
MSKYSYTKKDFEEAIKEFHLATLEDLDNLLKNHNSKLFKVFATKQYLDENFVTKEEFRESSNKALNLLDEMYGFMKKRDQEQTVMSHQVNNHENRITKIETAIA